jgi:uncharacterized C2H2 Zn-finger protein
MAEILISKNKDGEEADDELVRVEKAVEGCVLGEFMCPRCGIVFNSRRRFVLHTSKKRSCLDDRNQYEMIVRAKIGKILNGYNKFVKNIDNPEIPFEKKKRNLNHIFNTTVRVLRMMRGLEFSTIDDGVRKTLFKILLNFNVGKYDSLDTSEVDINLCELRFLD